MKIRNGFVSNSSSSSFILHKSDLGEEGFNKLVDEIEDYLEKNNDEDGDDLRYVMEVVNDYLILNFDEELPEEIRYGIEEIQKKCGCIVGKHGCYVE